MTESAVIAPVGELDVDSVRALAPQLDAADYPRLAEADLLPQTAP